MKTRNTEKSISLLKSVKSEVTGQTVAPKTEETTENQLTRTETQELKSSIGTSAGVWKLPVIDKSPEANCGQVREIKNSRGTHSHFCGFYLQEFIHSSQ